VPYYLVHRKGMRMDGTAAGLVSAYGGFGVSWLPSYANREFKTDIGWPILERGGVFVMANIRGGGEYGPAWHDAARRGLRQNGLDDLAAVAQDLVRLRAVAPGRLAMIGGSNGGLLAAATGIQRPELFKALIAEVPLTDMMRYTKLYTGSVWINEYGDPDDPVEAARLRAFSPLQNVKPGVHYPEMLLVTSTADDRVHPGHARRLAEKLRSVGQPVLFHEATEGGHEGLASVDQQARERALETVYLLQALQLK
jgi:prolyl oligopeptidase